MRPILASCSCNAKIFMCLVILKCHSRNKILCYLLFLIYFMLRLEMKCQYYNFVSVYFTVNKKRKKKGLWRRPGKVINNFDDHRIF